MHRVRENSTSQLHYTHTHTHTHSSTLRTLLSVELDGETTGVTSSISATLLTTNSRETKEDGSLLANVAQELGLGKMANVMGDLYCLIVSMHVVHNLTEW